jgi:hypothetical protein
LAPSARDRDGEQDPAARARRQGWETAIDEVVAMQHLDDDWDGLGAKAPSRVLLESAIALAYVLLEKGTDPPTRAVPGLEGTVLLEWQFPDGSYGEIEVTGQRQAEVMLKEPGKPARHWALPSDQP